MYNTHFKDSPQDKLDVKMYRSRCYQVARNLMLSFNNNHNNNKNLGVIHA